MTNFMSRYRNEFSPLQLYREMNRLFDEPQAFHTLWSDEGERGLEFSPRIDVEEGDEEVLVTAELPGMKEKDIDIELNQGTLTIRGEKEEKKSSKRSGLHVRERRFGSFERSFSIPGYVDDQSCEAHYENGVLQIRMKKKQEALQGKKIKIH